MHLLVMVQIQALPHSTTILGGDWLTRDGCTLTERKEGRLCKVNKFPKNPR